MNVELEKKEGNIVEFSMEVPYKEFDKAVNKVYLKNKSYINIPGFRKGKAPRKIIELSFGEDVFHEEAINILLEEKYPEAIEKLELEPVESGEVTDVSEIKKGEDIKITAKVTVKPEVKLGDYKGIEVEEVKAEVSEDLIDEELAALQEMNARIIPLEEGTIEEGHIANIDFEGSIDGETFPGGAAEAYDLEIGSGSFIPGFEEQLVGKKEGEEVDVEVTFPEDYGQEDLAGKDAVFAVKINSVKEKELPELDDEFAKDISEFDTIEEYKEDLRSKMKEEEELKAKNMNTNNLLEKIVDNAEIDLPEVMIDNQVNVELNEFAYTLQMQGLNIEQYFQLTGTSLEGFKEDIRPVAETRVRTDLVLEEIAKVEEITVTEEDIDESLEKIAEQQNREDVEEFKADMKKGDLSYLEDSIVREKTVDFLLDNAKFI